MQRMSRPAVRLAEALYAGVADDTNWEVFLRELARQCHGQVAMLFAHDYRTGAIPFVASSGLDSAMQRAYQARLGRINPWVADQEHMPEGSVVLSHRLASDPCVPATEYYADFMRPTDTRFAIGSTILKSAGSAVKLGVLRSERQGPMSDRAQALLSSWMPTLQSAMRLRSRLVALEARNKVQWDVLDALPVGLFLLNAKAEVVASNKAGERLVSAGEGLAIGASGALVCRSPVDDRRLAAAITEALRGIPSLANGGLLAVGRFSAGQPYTVQVMAVDGTALSLGGSVRVALFVSDPTRSLDGLELRLSELFGLTRSEARLTARIAGGQNLKEAARSLGITEDTARFVSKKVFAKTSTTGQPDLVRVILSSVATWTTQGHKFVSPKATR